MPDWTREISEALRDDPPRIDPRHYRDQADVIGRKGVEWVEKQTRKWEDDHPGGKR